MTVKDLKMILQWLDDDMEVFLEITDEAYNVHRYEISGYNSYDGDSLKLEAEEPQDLQEVGSRQF